MSQTCVLFGDGGTTHLANLDPQCRWHHLLETHTGWTVTRGPDRALTVTTPSGTSHHYPAAAHTLPGE